MGRNSRGRREGRARKRRLKALERRAERRQHASRVTEYKPKNIGKSEARTWSNPLASKVRELEEAGWAVIGQRGPHEVVIQKDDFIMHIREEGDRVVVQPDTL